METDLRPNSLRRLAASALIAAAACFSLSHPLTATAATGPSALRLPPLPPLPPHTATKLSPQAAATPHDAAAMGGYDLLIADRGNRRLIIVTPQKKIIWTYTFHDAPPGNGADDSFFADGGRTILTNLEHSYIIRKIDIATGKAVWQYGKMNVHGTKRNRLYFPDDAYQLPNGNIVVADIRNCRILEISPDKKVVRQAGRTGDCSGHPGTLRSPNGDRPLANGHLLVSEIQGHWLTELDQNWKEVMRFKLPILYPSDPQPTLKGNIVVAGYTHPGHIIIVNRQQKVLWRYKPQKDGGLNRPSLAEELPNGNIIATDDLNHRIVVIDPKTNKIVWQYGVKGHPGSAPGYLRIPDGLDIIPEVRQ